MANERRANQVGFTLVELLIVIVILGILAGIVVFAVGNTSRSAAKSACGTEAPSFYTAYQAYKAQNNGAIPAGATDNAAGATAVMNALTTGNNQFLQRVPTGTSANTNAFYDDQDFATITAGTAQGLVNAKATAVNHPVWTFLPSTGAVYQSNVAAGSTLNCSNQ